jgi:hypothetical protein
MPAKASGLLCPAGQIQQLAVKVAQFTHQDMLIDRIDVLKYLTVSEQLV